MPATDTPETTKASMPAQLDRAVWRVIERDQMTLLKIFAIIGCTYYAGLALIHPFAIGGKNGLIMAFSAGVTSITLFVVLHGIRNKTVPSKTCHNIALLFAMLATVNVFLHIFVTMDHIQLTLIPVLPVLFGVLFVKRSYFWGTYCVVIPLTITALVTVPGPYTVHFLFLSAPSYLLGAVMFFPKVSMLQRMFGSLLENRRQNRLLAASNARAQRLYKRAVEGARARSLFVSSMSHELRTPLTSVLGFAELLATNVHDASKSAQNEAHAQRIVQSGSDLLNQINRILDLADIDSGTAKLNFTAISVGPFVDSVIEMIEPYALRAGNRIETESAGPLDSLRFVADAERCRQVLFNLLHNALKYGGRNVNIVLRYERTAAGAIRFLVIDDGPGVPEEMQARMFVPFERLQHEAGPIEGAGLGLAIAKSLVELMDGNIGVVAGTDSGLTIFCEFPLTK